MAETILVNAASVLAGASSAVVAHAMAVPPEVDFRVACDQLHSVRFYAADATFSAITGAALLPAYTETAVDPTTGTTGNVYRVSPGSYDHIACVVTNDGALPATTTVAVGYDLVAPAPTALFTVAEARAFDGGVLANATTYPDATIIAAEARIRQTFSSPLVCDVAFIPTVEADEAQDGGGARTLVLNHSKLISVSAASIDGVALTAAQLSETDYSSGLAVYREEGYIARRSGCWMAGRLNCLVTYSHGWAAVPADVKRAALMLLVAQLPKSVSSNMATRFSDDSGSYDLFQPSGNPGYWYAIPEVNAILRLYSRAMPGIA
jgi:hypothetical protein